MPTGPSRTYQYANRLAHLYFLKEINHIDARLVFVYFVNDHQMHGPRSESEWKKAIDKVHQHLDVKADMLENIVSDVFIDITKLNFAKTPVNS